ncbi:MAG: exodeoxyribonuclease VII large subunit, partial [Planctomycetota bacterium]
MPTPAYANATPPDAESQALSVAQLTARIKGLLEESIPDVWVAGEVSNFSRPASGHCYFTLKDEHAQIRAVVWRGAATRMKFDLTDGLELLCHGRIDVYAPRGSYQLVIDQAQPKGVGALELALRQLREKLAAEGLFDAGRKRPLPAFPRRIGFVTSPTGAAIRDFLQVARRRWRGVQVLVIPTRVQGDGAAEEIAAGIRLADQLRPRLDALVVGRGGGSVEDLWAFNEEPVVRALAASATPTVSAVGHEIDVTLSDLAADVRALTPSEAAELVAPSAEETIERLAALSGRMRASVARRVQQARQRVDSLATRRPLSRPYAVID